MTDKELRKLSRLELLEMLLDVTKENEKLRKQLDETREENKAASSIENLSAAAVKINSALEYVNSLAVNLQGKKQESAEAEAAAAITSDEVVIPVSDLELYAHIIAFFAVNDKALDVLSEDLRFKVEKRITKLLEKRNSN